MTAPPREPFIPPMGQCLACGGWYATTAGHVCDQTTIAPDRRATPAPSAPVICHAPGDKCFGCDHYHGRAARCSYAPPAAQPADQPINEGRSAREQGPTTESADARLPDKGSAAASGAVAGARRSDDPTPSPAAQPAEPTATDDLVSTLLKLHDRRERHYLGGATGQACGLESYRIVATGNQLACMVDAAAELQRHAREIAELRAECVLRQIQGYNEGKEAASARLYEAEAEQLTRDMRQRAERAERELALHHHEEWANKLAEVEAERDALRADAERYRWLRPRLYSIDFDYSETHATVLVFEAPVHPLGPGTALDAAIDAARAKVKT